MTRSFYICGWIGSKVAEGEKLKSNILSQDFRGVRFLSLILRPRPLAFRCRIDCKALKIQLESYSP